MKKLIALASAFALISGQALADYSYTQGSGTTIKAGTVSGAVLPWFAPVDANGVAVTGTLAAGAAPTSGFPFLCEYLSGGITLTTGQTAAIQCTAAGSLHTTVDNASLAVTGTFWQATQPVSGTVTANAGTNLNTSALALESGGNLASIKTDVDNLNLAQGSTTSGQKGNLNLGAVTTGAPTYMTGQSSPLSLDTAGNLRVNVMAGGGSGGTSSSFGAAFPSTGTAAGLEYLSSPPTLTSGNMAALMGDVNGNLKINIQGCASAVCAPLGQTTMSGSAPVTIASDQSAIPVKTSGDPCFGSAKTNLAISRTRPRLRKSSPHPVRRKSISARSRLWRPARPRSTSTPGPGQIAGRAPRRFWARLPRRTV